MALSGHPAEAKTKTYTPKQFTSICEVKGKKCKGLRNNLKHRKILWWRLHPKANAERKLRKKFFVPRWWLQSSATKAVGRCESGNSYTRLSNHRDEKGRHYDGRWQFYLDTWNGFTSVAKRFPRAIAAPGIVQDYVAFRLWKNSGSTFSRHWPQCGARY